MNIDKDNDLIDQLNRLLEWLHQSDGQHIGSHITLIKVEKGAQYVNQVGTQVFNNNKPDAPARACLCGLASGINGSYLAHCGIEKICEVTTMMH